MARTMQSPGILLSHDAASKFHQLHTDDPAHNFELCHAARASVAHPRPFTGALRDRAGDPREASQGRHGARGRGGDSHPLAQQLRPAAGDTHAARRVHQLQACPRAAPRSARARCSPGASLAARRAPRRAARAARSHRRAHTCRPRWHQVASLPDAQAARGAKPFAAPADLDNVYTVTTDEIASPHELDREKLLKDPLPGAPHEGFADQAADAAGVLLDFAPQRAASLGSARGRPSHAESPVRSCSDSATSPLPSGHGWFAKAALPGGSPQARWDSDSSCSDPSSAAHQFVPRHARTHFRVHPAMELPRIGFSQDSGGALRCEAAGFTPEYSRRTRGGEKTAAPEPGARGGDERVLENALHNLVPEDVALSRVTPPPPSRTKWTRLVHPSVLIRHVSSLFPVPG
jgi:hypothetical protein